MILDNDKWLKELIDASGVTREKKSDTLKELKRMASAGIDVIVPVYKGIEETTACLESVLQDDSFPLRLTAIADCPPESGMTEALYAIAQKHAGRMKVIVHEKNMGFVRTVNEGMSETTGDVVLLNSDTLVPKGWLTSLCTSAAFIPLAATVTPLSTSAGPFTLFKDNQISKEDFPLYAQAVRKLHGQAFIKVPTGHGFCLFIRRAAIESVGLFNAEIFGRGYGEENDFCQRAISKGFINVADFSTLIYHAEAISFGGEKSELVERSKEILQQLHPNYKSEIARCFSGNEWRGVMGALEARITEYLSLNPSLDPAPKKRLLVAMHEGAGGSINNRNDMMRALSDRYDCFFLTGNMKAFNLRYVGANCKILLETISLEYPMDNLTFERDDVRRIYERILLRYNIGAVNMSHLLGETFDLVKLCREMDIPCLYVLHDFYTLCPDFQLTDKDMHFCGGKCREGCVCAGSAKWLRLPRESVHKYVSGWRTAMREYLPLFDMLCAPDKSVKYTFASVYPELESRVRVIEHGRDLEEYAKVDCSYPKEGEKIKLAIIGSIGPAKGLTQIEELLEEDKEHKLEIHIFGNVSADAKLSGVILHGGYERGALSGLLDEAKPSYGLLPGVFAETYCHTLTELWAMGLPVIASAVGALKTRMEKAEAGWLFEPRDTKALYKLITEGISESDYERAKKNALALKFPTTADMAREYEKILFLGDRLKIENEETHIARTNLMQTISPFGEAEASAAGGAPEKSALSSKETATLKRQVKELRHELKHSLTCYRRQIGDSIVDAWTNKRLLPKLPYKLYKINRDYRRVDAPAVTAAAAPIRKAEEVFEMKYPEQTAPRFPDGVTERTIDIIVCVHNALSDVKRCLQSLLERRTFPFGIIIVDDGSDNVTAEFLKEFMQNTGARLIRHDTSAGYTISANEGLRLSTADYMILLNSDTIVTDRFCEKMLRAFDRNKNAGVLSPLSNAATYQSVPDVYSGNSWAVNDLPQGLTPDAVSLAVERAGEPTYPHLKCVNGFCFMISRACIDKIGYLDEESFPKGYGEEVDYCLRAEKAGIECRVLDDTYIYHAKSKSFTDTGRRILTASSEPTLRAKHGDEFAVFTESLKNNAEMQAAHERACAAIKKMQETLLPLRGKRVVFILPVNSASGGANSVCQEAAALRALGIDAKIANLEKNRSAFTYEYGECGDWTLWYKKTPDEIAELADIAVATMFHSARQVAGMKRINPHLKSAYYVQDYEPLFFPDGSDHNIEALASYTLDKDMLLFAKTDWICKTVETHHSASVKRVVASIDWKVYNPYRITKREGGEALVVSAMLRPSTRRRNPRGTLIVLKAVKEALGDAVEIRVFGCESDELEQYSDIAGFPMINSGYLRRTEVAELLAMSDLFIDMSDYQAFGRTGIEAMALGCVPLLPEKGGADEYAVNGKNAIIADTSDAEGAAEKVISLLQNRAELARMSESCLETARRYNAFFAAMSEAELFAQKLSERKSFLKRLGERRKAGGVDR
ncbi:MAG: glycosyltransferase [Eubacteriales bacterium]|nr:glycosyltransferase [Eubacteriales bacterium]MDD3881400.1 glycosyltransferase [Eubacteriales bacterium]MDD4513087.1 glycosyltransferase [Eubacteriales bacterium]